MLPLNYQNLCHTVRTLRFRTPTNCQSNLLLFITFSETDQQTGGFILHLGSMRTSCGGLETTEANHRKQLSRVFIFHNLYNFKKKQQVSRKPICSVLCCCFVSDGWLTGSVWAKHDLQKTYNSIQETKLICT